MNHSSTFSNPVIPGFYSDPSICRDGDHYYAVFSSFEFFPGVPVFHSMDLINWDPLSYCLTSEEQLPLKNAGTSDGIYAPTLRFHNGLFYMITSNRCAAEGNHFYVTAASMSGPFSAPTWIRNPDGSSIDGVDPSLFFDDDGTVYFSCVAWDEHGQGIGQAPIDLDSGTLLAPLRIVWHGTGGTFPEGPHTYKINGFYYLMIAEGGTEYGHKVSIARSVSINGPYDSCPHNPILTQNYQYVQSECIQGVGHGDLFEAADHTWWLIVHGFRTSIGKLHHLGRETMLAPVEWDETGWPVVNQHGWLDQTISLGGAFQSVIQRPIQGFIDDFSGSEPHLRWNFLRSYHPQQYQFSGNGVSGLTLYGITDTISGGKTPTWIGTRQRHFSCRINVDVCFSPKTGDEAGITVYQTPEHHYDLVITRKNDLRICCLKKTIGDIVWTSEEVILSSPRISLHIQADRSRYTFTVSCDGTICSLGSGRTQLLSTEAMQYQNFTGTFFAMYAQSVNEHSSPAHFLSFEYIPGID